MTYFVPLIIRGRIIEDHDLEFGGRRGGVRFTTPDVKKHLHELVLSRPSTLADIHELKFDEIADYLDMLHDRLTFTKNPYLQEAVELYSQTSAYSLDIVRDIYSDLPRLFSKRLVQEIAERTIGIAYLDGWVEQRLVNGCISDIRAFGARAVHLVAGNSPTVSANSIVRNVICRSDMIIKAPSNDPLTAIAIAQTMIEMAPDHPITKHISVAYWKGGDTSVEESIYSPKYVEKIVAWGGLASISHIRKYMQPGIDLITLDPKLSSTIIGREAFADDSVMKDAAQRLACDVGARNQEGCVNARVIYIETGTDAAGLEKANSFGKMLYDEIQALPSCLSSPAKDFDPALRDEINTLRLGSVDHKIFGGGNEGGVIVSQNDEPVEFARILYHRVANLVPIDDVEVAVQSVTAYTQTIGIFPESLKKRLRDRLVYHGAQRLTSLGYASGGMSPSGPHDSIEILRRMCKWIVEENYDPAQVPLASSCAR